MTDTIDLVWKSFRDFKNNLILLVPALIQLVLILVLGIFVALQALLGHFIFGSMELTPSFVLYLIPLGITDYIILLFIAAYTSGAQYGVIMDVVTNGKSSFKRLLRHGRTYTLPIFTYWLAAFVVVLFPLAIFGILTVAAAMAAPAFGITMGVLLFLVYVLFIIALSILSLFSTPILISRKLYGFSPIIEAIKYGKANLGHVFITLAVLILMWIVLMFIYMAFLLPAMIGEIALQAYMASNIPAYIAGTIAIRLPANIVSWIGGIIISIFLFNSYADKNKIKWK